MGDDLNLDGAGPAPRSDAAQNMVQRVMALYGRIDEVMEEMRVPGSERQQVEQNLMEAVAADLMTRLGSKMSDNERQELAELAGSVDVSNPDLQSVAGFFRGKFDQEELMSDLVAATESVLGDFVKEMGK